MVPDFLDTESAEVSDTRYDEDDEEYSWTLCEVQNTGAIVAGGAKVVEVPSVIRKVDGVVIIAHGADLVEIPADRRGCPRSA